jgi:hypothetical protein
MKLIIHVHLRYSRGCDNNKQFKEEDSLETGVSISKKQAQQLNKETAVYGHYIKLS